MHDVLGSVSEFSIGLAGFSGVVAALLQRNRELKAIDRLRVTVNVVVALTPGIWALAFLSITELGVHYDSAILWVSAGVLASNIGWVVLALGMRFRLPVEQKTQFNPIVMGIVLSITPIWIVLSVYNIVVLPRTASGILAIVLVLTLVQAASMFVGMLWQLMGNASASTES